MVRGARPKEPIRGPQLVVRILKASSSWAGKQGAACSPLGLPIVLGHVVGQAVQNEDLSPFGALVQGCQ